MAEETGPTPAAEPERGVGGVADLLRDSMRQEQEKAAETLEDSAEETPEETPEPGATDDGDGEPAGDQPADDTDSEPERFAFDQLAEAAGMSVDELYRVELPLGDERGTTTLGAIKDKFREVLRVDQLHGEMESQRVEFENSMIRARGELNQVIQMLGPNVTPELVQMAQQQTRDHAASERELLSDIKPEWRDDKKFQQAQTEILEAVSDYGFGRGDLDLVVDHRLVKLLHDFAGMKARVKSAELLTKEVRDTGRLQRSKKKADTNRKHTVTELAALSTKAKGGDREAMGQAVQRLMDDAGVKTR